MGVKEKDACHAAPASSPLQHELRSCLVNTARALPDRGSGHHAAPKGHFQGDRTCKLACAGRQVLHRTALFYSQDRHRLQSGRRRWSRKRATGRVVAGGTRVVFGTQEGVAMDWATSPVSQPAHTSFVERDHLTQRQSHRRLPRRMQGFSKDLTWCEKPLWVSRA